MTNLELLTKAIKERKPISLQYVKPGKTVGERICNPYAIFIHPSTHTTQLDVIQTAGVTDEPNEEFPKWNQFKIEYLSDLKILEDEPQFKIHPQYNPNSPKYSQVIEKI